MSKKTSLLLSICKKNNTCNLSPRPWTWQFHLCKHRQWRRQADFGRLGSLSSCAQGGSWPRIPWRGQLPSLTPSPSSPLHNDHWPASSPGVPCRPPPTARPSDPWTSSDSAEPRGSCWTTQTCLQVTRTPHFVGMAVYFDGIFGFNFTFPQKTSSSWLWPLRQSSTGGLGDRGESIISSFGIFTLFLWNVFGIFFFLFGLAHLKVLGNMGYFQQGNISNSTLGVSCAINHSAAGYYSNIHQDETLQLHNP